jgi:hypothetical protein
MAMMRITPMPVRVSCDWFSGRPRAVRLGEETMPVTTVASVREESAAYPAGTGPRTRFEVLTPSARLGLTYEHRRRRWVVDGVDMEEPPLRAVA